MRNLLLVITLIAANVGSGFAQRKHAAATKGVAVAFFDEERLRTGSGQAALSSFEYFYELIEDIVKRDFPGVELRILGRGELLPLPDGTRLNVQTIQPELGFVLSSPGKKRLVLSGIRSDIDFACAASTFFERHSTACPK
jgi:hypothetical protein